MATTDNRIHRKARLVCQKGKKADDRAEAPARSLCLSDRTSPKNENTKKLELAKCSWLQMRKLGSVSAKDITAASVDLFRRGIFSQCVARYWCLLILRNGRQN